MKPNETKLERLVKKAVRGSDVSREELLQHWRGLGRRGNRAVINLLNRLNGWDSFQAWANRDPETQKQLAAVTDLAGSEIASDAADSPRLRALWIRDAVERKQDWDRAQGMLLADDDLLEGTLVLLEQSASLNAADFLTTVLESSPSDELDRQIRKSLYHLKQQGIVVERSSSIERSHELFAFSDNRMPFFQIILYFRPYSVFSDAGDLYILQLIEGQQAQKPEQQSGLRLDARGLGGLSTQYSNYMERQTGMRLEFHLVPSEEARYFLGKSVQLLQSHQLNDFLHFIGQAEIVDPKKPGDPITDLVIEQATPVLMQPYFQSWILPPDDLKEFQQKLKELSSGPIVLPEPQIRERQHMLAAETLRKLFDERSRRLWSYAFEKAWYFLKDSDAATAESALILSRAFADLTIGIEKLPAAAVLFERTLQYVQQEEAKKQQEEKRSSLIMSPQEFQQQQQTRHHEASKSPKFTK